MVISTVDGKISLVENLTTAKEIMLKLIHQVDITQEKGTTRSLSLL